MKKLFAIALALSLCACTTVSSIPQAPLAHTTIDDTALETAWKSFDLALDAINILTDQGVIKPGTERAKAVASGIRRVNAFLTAAESAAAAGSTTDYLSALANAKAALTELRTALK